MEQSRIGVSPQGNPLFQSPDAYQRATLSPFLKIAFLEGLAGVYKGAKRPDDACRIWQDMYESATAMGGTAIGA
jgi:hypothetical protein